MIGQAIYSILNGTTAITDVVTGIFPVVAKQGAAFPYIIHQQVTTLPTDQKDGGSPLDQVRYQIDTYAKTKASADGIAENIRTALDRYSGTAASVAIQSIKFLDQFDGAFEEELVVYRVTQEFQIRQHR